MRRVSRRAKIVPVILLAVATGLLAAAAASAQSAPRPDPRRDSLSAVLPLADPPPGSGQGDPNVCGLIVPGSDAATSRDCLACHGRLAHGGHVYDLRYSGHSSGSASAALRPIDEAVRRGAFLPDGQIRCVTCHDGRSPWKYNLRLPPGAQLMPAVDLRRPVTYENPRALPAPRPGGDVGRKPLCLTCHALD